MDDTLPLIQACAMRVARLGPDGVPLPGAHNLYVTDALSELSMTPVYKDGDEIEETNACGAVAISYLGPPTFKRADIALTIMTPDPYLQQLLGGGAVLTDGGVHGYAWPAIGVIGGDGISIELWSKRIDNGALATDYPYMWTALPRITNLKHGQRTYNNGAQLPVFSGQALENPNWYDGPLNDWPVASDRVSQQFPVNALPAVTGTATLAAS